MEVPEGSTLCHAVFEKGNKIVVAFRGTDPKDRQDLLGNDVKGIGLGMEPKCGYAFAEATIKGLQDKYDRATIFVTGHSLGGWMAEIVSTRLNLPGASFCGPGAGKKFTVLGHELTSTLLYGEYVEKKGESTSRPFRVINTDRDFLGNMERSRHSCEPLMIHGLPGTLCRHAISPMSACLAANMSMTNVHGPGYGPATRLGRAPEKTGWTKYVKKKVRKGAKKIHVDSLIKWPSVRFVKEKNTPYVDAVPYVVENIKTKALHPDKKEYEQVLNTMKKQSQGSDVVTLWTAQGLLTPPLPPAPVLLHPRPSPAPVLLHPRPSPAPVLLHPHKK